MADYTLKTRAEALKKHLSGLDADLSNIAQGATIRAIEKAAELTPPTKDDLSGTNTRTGAMKQHWATDSVIKPQKVGNDFVTQLANNMEYASYINDGHRMDRHFVPGLVINPYSGLLEYNHDGKGGIVVGTKTAYVNGLFMVDEAQEEYKRVTEIELSKLAERVNK